MSNQSNVRGVLDDLVREDAPAVRVDPEAAWRRGRQRRTRNRIGAVGAMVAVLGVGAATLTLLHDPPDEIEPSGGSGDVATEHPRRLEYVYWNDDQPEVTGPLAGLVYRNGDGVSGWYSVSPKGHLWHLPDVTDDSFPAVSPDGTHLAYLRGDIKDAAFVITNQLDGSEQTFPQIGSGVESSDVPYFNSGQTPSYWSPDGSTVMVRVGLSDLTGAEADPAAVVLGTDGTFALIPEPPGSAGASPVGWAGDDQVVLLGRPAATNKVHVWVVEVPGGHVVRDFALDVGAAHYERAAQWFGTVAPGGNQLATADEQRIRYYATQPPRQGRVYSTTSGVPSAADTCLPSWSSSDLFVPTTTERDGASAILVRANGGTTIVADPGLDIVCSSWAQTALDGPAHQSLGTRLFGKDDSWLSWHWREVSASGLVIILLLGAGVVVAIVRRRKVGADEA